MLALLRAGARLTVLNVFTRSDYAVDLRTVDTALPLVDAVSRARRLEDERFLADVAAMAGREPGSVILQDLGDLDAPLRLSVRTEAVLEAPLTADEVQEQATHLAGRLTSGPEPDLLFAPLALGDHIDHRISREASRLACVAERLCFYEDLPYAARLSSTERKEQTIYAISSNSASLFSGWRLQIPEGRHLKSRFAKHYPSQIAPEVAEEMGLYAGEGCEDGAGAERWWAMPPAGTRVARLLQQCAAPGTLFEEQR